MSQFARAIVCAVLAFAVACTRQQSPVSPTAPAAPTPLPPIVASYAGVWHGNFTIAHCQGRRHCVFSIGQHRPFVLLLDQAGSHVTGMFQVESFGVPVQGDISTDGELTLRGRRDSPGALAAAVELTRFTARQSASAGLLADLTYRLRYPDTVPEGVNSKEQSISGVIASAARGQLPAANAFGGRWTGSLVIRDCAPANTPGCWPRELGHEGTYELTLSQSGDRVTGVLKFEGDLSVTGTVADNSLTLDRITREDPISSGRSFVHLERWTMTRGEAGGLRGSLIYSRETVWNSLVRSPNAIIRFQGDIVSGTQQP